MKTKKKRSFQVKGEKLLGNFEGSEKNGEAVTVLRREV